LRPSDSNIVDLALATPDLSTLVTALKAGDLVTSLSGPGPFTVFAPTNEAFGKLPTSTLTHLLDPRNKQELVDILTYHVASGKVLSTDLRNGERIKTLEGGEVEVHLSLCKKVYINNARVETANVNASNGVIHIIDNVLLPPHLENSKTIVDLAVGTPDLSTLVTALKAGDLVKTLSGPGPFTVFAPTNEAFAKLPQATLKHLLEAKNKQELVDILTYHVVSGRVLSTDLRNDEDIKTLEGASVKVHLKDSGVYINDAQVTTANVVASNGVVHIIDSVLLA
jgi:uncharacterized surface protein with fasciclin (FAS1) repeats